MNITKHIVTSANWDSGRGGHNVTGIVLHTMVGYIQGAEDRFNDPSSGVSVHYGIGEDGSIRQWVEESNTAWQAGNYPVNQTTIGIEHEDKGNYNDSVRTAQLYDSSSSLVADICKRYNFPANSSHIFLHKNVIDKSRYPGGTACPDGLDTNKIISMAAAKLGGTMETFNEGDRVNINNGLFGYDKGFFKTAVGTDWKTAIYAILQSTDFKNENTVNDGDVANINSVLGGSAAGAKGKVWKQAVYNYILKNIPAGSINHDTALKYVQDNLK